MTVTDPFLCLDVHAYLCMGMFISVASSPGRMFSCKHRRCIWSRMSQMREFQMLLDFSVTRMSCGFGLDGSNMTQYCWCRRKGDDDKGLASTLFLKKEKKLQEALLKGEAIKRAAFLKSFTGNNYIHLFIQVFHLQYT